MAAGFSYGGWTALSMGGLRGNHAGYVGHCAEYGAASSHCDDLMSKEIRLAEVSADEWNRSYADARITHVMAIEPGLVWGLAAEDGEGLVENVSMIGLGDGGNRLLAANFDASGFADLLPDAEIDRIVPGFHFTAMPLCKPAGEAILIEEKDDPVCTDPEGADRAAIHARIVDRIAADLGL
jgi:predicted dienelactone hydrolase